MQNEEEAQNAPGQNEGNQKEYVQFHGQIDYRNYREFRIRQENLKNIPATEPLDEKIKTGLRGIIEKHVTKIALLEDEIRHHHQMKRNWTLFANVPNEHNKEIVAKIIGSNQADIETFETENFGPDCSWSQQMKLKSDEEMSQLFSFFKHVNKNGEEIPISRGETLPIKDDVVASQPPNNQEQEICLVSNKETYASERVVNNNVPKSAVNDRNVSRAEKKNLSNNCEDHSDTARMIAVGENKKITKLTRKYLVKTARNVAENDGSTNKLLSAPSKKDHETAERKSLLSDEQESDDSADENESGTEKSCQTAMESARTNVENECDSSFDLFDAKETSNEPGKRRSQPAGKSSSKKGKKGKKGNKGPKMTLEEIEAIKKKKKEETDRAFEKRQSEMSVHMEKVNKTDKSRLHRKIAETALKILRVGSGILPYEIQQLNKQFDEFVGASVVRDRYALRDEYMLRRVTEVNETLMGTERFSKLDQIAAFDEVMERSEDIIPHIIFSHTLDPQSEEYAAFEEYLFDYCYHGEEGPLHPISEDLLLRLNTFKKEVMKVHRCDQFTRGHGILLARMIYLDTLKANKAIGDYELKIRYRGISMVLETSLMCINIVAFLQANRDSPIFNLMEAWFLEAKRPSAEVTEIISK